METVTVPAVAAMATDAKQREGKEHVFATLASWSLFPEKTPEWCAVQRFLFIATHRFAASSADAPRAWDLFWSTLVSTGHAQQKTQAAVSDVDFVHALEKSGVPLVADEDVKATLATRRTIGRIIAEKVRKVAGPQFSPRRILDVGCKEGARLVSLGECFGCKKEDLVGCDPSDEYDRLEEHSKTFEFRKQKEAGKIPNKKTQDDAIKKGFSLILIRNTLPDFDLLLLDAIHYAKSGAFIVVHGSSVWSTNQSDALALETIMTAVDRLWLGIMKKPQATLAPCSLRPRDSIRKKLEAIGYEHFLSVDAADVHQTSTRYSFAEKKSTNETFFSNPVRNFFDIFAFHIEPPAIPLTRPARSRSRSKSPAGRSIFRNRSRSRSPKRHSDSCLITSSTKK